MVFELKWGWKSSEFWKIDEQNMQEKLKLTLKSNFTRMKNKFFKRWEKREKEEKEREERLIAEINQEYEQNLLI